MTQPRRVFLQRGLRAGAGLVIWIEMPRALGSDGTKPFEPNAYLSIGTDNKIRFWVTRSEMGQGVRTTLPVMLAEELEVELAQVSLEQAMPGGRFKGIRLRTSGSGSTVETYKALRKAGASAREMLIAAAAERWGVDAASCKAANGSVLHPSSKRKLTYGQLADDAARQKAPDNPPLRDPKKFRLIGKPQVRLDGASIVSGQAVYGADVRVPGMLYAVMARCPYIGGKVASFDAVKALAVAGVRHVVPIKSGIATGVAVVADHTWAAMKGRDVLKVEWEPGPNRDFDSDQFLNEAEKALDGVQTQYVVRNDGDAASALSMANRKLEAVYSTPFHAHAPMETMNCVADVRQDSCEIWVPTQCPEVAQADTAKMLGLPEDSVKIHITMLGGGFGRRLFADYVPEAVELSRAIGRPVQLMWTRADDMGRGFFHPSDVERIGGGLDEHGDPIAWVQRSVFSDLSMFGFPSEADRKNLKYYAENEMPWGSFDNPYHFPHLKADVVPFNSPVPTGPWRAVFYPPTVFARESFLDEMAHAAGRDPLAMRLRLLEPGDVLQVGGQKINRARLIGVLKAAADEAGWTSPLAKSGDRLRGRGIACNVYSADCYVAQVAEVSVGRKSQDIRVDRIVCAVDCGVVINPLGLRGQAESGVVWGLSAAMHSRMDFRKGAAVQENFHDYEVTRMTDAPQIDTVIVQSDAPPGGFGETAVPPVAPAIANAIFSATGKRLRSLPLTTDKLRTL